MKRFYLVIGLVLAVVFLVGAVNGADRWSQSRWSGQDRLIVDNLMISGSDAFTTTALTDEVTGDWGANAIAMVCWRDSTTKADSSAIYVKSLTAKSLIVGRTCVNPSAQTYNYYVKRVRKVVK